MWKITKRWTARKQSFLEKSHFWMEAQIKASHTNINLFRLAETQLWSHLSIVFLYLFAEKVEKHWELEKSWPPSSADIGAECRWLIHSSITSSTQTSWNNWKKMFEPDSPWTDKWMSLGLGGSYFCVPLLLFDQKKISSESKALKMIWWPVSLSQLQIYKADSECCRWVYMDFSTRREVTDDIQPNLQVSPSFSSVDQHRGDENRAGLRRQQKYPPKTARKQ